MKKRRGFTLIELLIVIAIIGILAVAFLPSILAAPAKARDAQRIETIKKINDFILYHYSVGTSGFSLPGGWYCIQPKIPLSGLNLFVNNNVSDFGGSFPKDPVSTWNPLSGSAASGWDCKGAYGLNRPSIPTFALFSRMERLEDANSCSPLGMTSTVGCATPYFIIISKIK